MNMWHIVYMYQDPMQVYLLQYFFFHIFRMIWFPCHIMGKENIPKEGGFIFASNHASNLDPFLIGIVPFREVYFFAKKELFKNMFFNIYDMRSFSVIKLLVLK